MKEMTIEEKAKAYDEAKARMSRAFNTNRCTIGFMNEIFPELKESDGEIIRKMCIKYLDRAYQHCSFADDMKNIEKCIAWLETQKNIADKEYVFRPLAGDTIEKAVGRAVKLDGKVVLAFNGAYIPVCNKTKDEIVAEYYDWIKKQGEQKQLYIRFGEIPTDEKSKIYQGEIEVGTENGVSVYPAFKTSEGDIVLGLSLPITKTTLYTQQHLIEYDDRPCYLVNGDYVGKDTDGQPLIKNVSIIKKIDTYRVKEKKQCVQKPFDYENANIQQNDFAPKAEPKFNVGDWIVNNKRKDVFLIKSFNKNGYCTLEDIKGNIIFPCIPPCESDSHIWTIKDAKDGDVLFQDLMDGKTFIYNGVNHNMAILYSFIISNDGKDVLPYHIGKPNTGIGNIEENKNIIHPATKEQRDLLFQIMKEKGYEWDSKKKELNKIEQKSVDEAEPKFHEGDWITDGYIHYKITDILDDRYIIESIYTKRSAILFEYENRYHIWTIKDAKNGDVLATSAGAFIYNANNGGGSCPGSYCGINTLGKFQIGTESHWTGKKVYPATKEQRDILFAHMKDAGYEWDSEKKEMKKIVQKSADKTESKFNVGNWYQCIKDFFGKGVTFDKNTAYYCAKEGCLQNQYGCHIAIVKDLYDNFKLWTIQDAKDGDVLYANGAPFIYKRHDKDYVYFYCGVNVGGYFIEANGIDIWDNSNKVYPATQEQRDLLFRKMKEAGYEWDNEKKELKKIIQKSMDKIELKFHEGDWVVNKLGDLWHIDSFDKQNYQVSDRKGNYNWFPISKQDEMRLWTIKDAKDGDVLACPLRKGPEAGEQIFIFKGINSRDYVDNCIEFYCRICEGVFYENKNGYMGTTSSSLYPATKEQRDLLFQEMKQSGYEWDDEKKELVKQPLKITPKFCVGQLITNNNGTWYKILNIKCLDDWYYKLYDVCEDNTHLELCSIIDEKFRLNRFVSEIKKMLKN